MSLKVSKMFLPFLGIMLVALPVLAASLVPEQPVAQPVVISTTAASTLAEATQCPFKVNYAFVEDGKFHYEYPVSVKPDWDNGREGKDFYAEYKDLKGMNLIAHCHKLENPDEVVKIRIPSTINKCVFFLNQFSCE